MAKSAVEARSDIRRVEQGARRAAGNPWSRAAVRMGYAAKGIVYLIIGVLLSISRGGPP